MKKLAIATLLLGALGMIVPAQQAQAQLSVSVSIGGFYDQLSPYGEWIDCSYGECWVPRGVAAGWQPYSNGQWIYTRYGWTWVSDDPWGADPYHYGTWAFVGRYGWAWVPGTVWAPAWVTWSYSDSYVGWAPMPPTVTFGRSGYSGRAVVVSETQYVFVPTNQFVATNVASVRVQPQQNAEIFRHAKPVTRFDVSGGILMNAALPLATIQRATGGKIETREISTARTTPRTFASGGGSGNVTIVAPARDVKAARASRQQAAPREATREAPRHENNGKAVEAREPARQAPAPEARREQAASPERRAEPQQRVRQERQQQPQQPQQQRQEPQQQPRHEARQEPQRQPQQQEQPQPRAQANPPAHQDRAPAVHPERPQQGREKGKPAGEEHGKDQNKGKKQKPAGEEPK